MSRSSLLSTIGRRSRRAWAGFVAVVIDELPMFAVSVAALGGIELLQDVYYGHSWPGFSMTDVLGRASLLVLYAWLFTALVHATKSRAVRVLYYALLLAVTTVDRFILYNFGAHFGPEPARLIFETNGREAADFFRSFLWSPVSRRAYLPTVVYLACIVAGEYGRKRIARLLSVPPVPLIAGLLTTAMCVYGLYCCRIFSVMFTNERIDHLDDFDTFAALKPTDPVSASLLTVTALRVKAREMAVAVQSTRQMQGQAVTVTRSDDSLHVALVIGESFIRRRSSLYGYARNTNPRLEQERARGNLIVFTDVVSPYNSTTTALKTMLCCNDLASGQAWYDYPYVPAVFRKAGYQVLMWDNQRNMSSGQTESFVINAFIYNPDIEAMSYSATNDRSYQFDMEIVRSLDTSSLLGHAPTLTIIHLLGQHFDARSRFPGSEAYFSADSVDRRESWLTPQMRHEIADYDNATRYNDKVLNAIFDLYRRRNAVVICLSDHGEEVYDYQPSKGRKFVVDTPDAARFQFEVPFFIWFSDTYRHNHAETVAAMFRATDRPFSIDRICHLMFSLAHIRCPWYNSGCDLISPDYRPGARVLNNDKDYDRLTNPP